MGSSPFARTEQQMASSTTSFSASSGLPVSFPSVTGMTSPQGEYTSPTFGRSHSHRTADGFLDHLFQCELGPPGFVPLCHWHDFSPGRIYVSDVWSLALAQNSRKLPRPLFRASFGRTHNEDGGSLPPGRATRITLVISALDIFRVVKITTLISVKQLIHSNLQVALQNAETLTFCFHVNLFLRFSWAKVRNHKKRVNTQPRSRLPYCRRYRKSGTEINRPAVYGSCHGGYVHPYFYEPFSILEAIRDHITFVVNLFQGCFRSAIDLEFKHID